MRLPFGLGLALSFVFACGAFGEGSTPAEPGDAGITDATTDAEADAVSPTVQKDADVPGDDDAGIPLARPCAVVDLCDDFERSFVEDPRWETPTQEGGGALSISTTYSNSATRSLSIFLPSSFQTDRRAYLRKNFASPATRVTARFHLHTEALPADADVVLAEMDLEKGIVFLMFQQQKFVVVAQDMTPTTIGQSETAFVVGQTHEIVFDYRSVLSPKATVKLDANELVVLVPNGGAVEGFEIGATYATDGSGAQYYVDDVAIDRGL